jgi:hypothetical protein
VLIVSIYVTLGITGVIPLWIVILVVSRDFMIVGAIILSWVVDRPVQIRPHMISKVNTGVQIVFPCLVLASHGYSFDAEPMLTLVMALVAVLTLLSVGLYLAEWIRHMNSAKSAVDVEELGPAEWCALMTRAAVGVLLRRLRCLSRCSGCSATCCCRCGRMALAYLLDPIARRAEGLGIAAAFRRCRPGAGDCGGRRGDGGGALRRGSSSSTSSKIFRLSTSFSPVFRSQPYVARQVFEEIPTERRWMIGRRGVGR